METNLIIISVLSLLFLVIFIVFFVSNFQENKEKFSSKMADSYRSYVINLKRSPERLASFIALYTESDIRNIPLSIVEAIDGKTIDITGYVTKEALTQILETEDTGYRTHHFMLSRGALGCYLSHLDVWRAVREQEEKYAIVFEDDVMFQKNILSQIMKIIDGLPRGWNVLLLGCICIKCSQNYADDAIKNVNQFWQTHAYVINKKVAPVLLKELDKKINMQIDSAMSVLSSSGKLDIYCVSHAIAKQNNGFKTTIQTIVIPGKNIDPFILLESVFLKN